MSTVRIAIPRAAAPWIWLLPALLLLLPGFCAPILLVARNSLNIDDPMGGMVAAFTFENYADILTDLFYARSRCAGSTTRKAR